MMPFTGRVPEKRHVGYVIAAYGIVLGSLVWYAWRVRRQRVALEEQRRAATSDERGP